MEEPRWEVVEIVNDSIQAELLRGFLEAQGIETIISKEGAGHALGLTIGMMGESQLLVRSEDKQSAMKILDDYHQGLFEEEPPNEGEADAGDSDENE